MRRGLRTVGLVKSVRAGTNERAGPVRGSQLDSMLPACPHTHRSGRTPSRPTPCPPIANGNKAERKENTKTDRSPGAATAHVCANEPHWSHRLPAVPKRKSGTGTGAGGAVRKLRETLPSKIIPQNFCLRVESDI